MAIDVKYLDSIRLEGICVYFGENKQDKTREKQSLLMLLDNYSNKIVENIINDIKNKNLEFDSSQRKAVEKCELKSALSKDDMEEYNAPAEYVSKLWLNGRKDKIRYVGELMHSEVSWDEIRKGDLLLVNSVPSIHFAKMVDKNYLTFYIDKVYRIQKGFAKIAGNSGANDSEGLNERLEELRKQAREVVENDNEVPDFE
jgi:hypothetical protein